MLKNLFGFGKQKLTPEEEVARLNDLAYEAIEVFDIRQALRIGNRLKKMRHSSAYEILALAYAADEKPDKAIAVLEEGVKAAPSVWRLWQLLGNYYSDDGRYGESINCYNRALECPDVDMSSVHYNASIALGRDERYEEALAHVVQVVSETSRPRATGQQMFLLNSAERYEECIALGENVIATMAWGEEYIKEQASVHAELAKAIWLRDHDGPKALDQAWKAVALDKGGETALWVIRDVTNIKSPNARHIFLMIRGRWHIPIDGETQPPHFFTGYDVVAESANEALELIHPFEPEPVRPTLEINECQLLENMPDQPKGVYKVNKYIFYHEDNE